MPFSPNPTGLSKASGTGEVTHTSVASSPQAWEVTKVKSSAGDVLVKSNWVFAVSQIGTIHVATLSLKPGYATTDPYLVTLFAQQDQVSVRVRFGNGDSETLFVNLGP